MFIWDRKNLDTREWSQQSLAGSPGPGLSRTNSTVCFLHPQRFLKQSTVESQESWDVKRKDSEAHKGQQWWGHMYTCTHAQCTHGSCTYVHTGTHAHMVAARKHTCTHCSCTHAHMHTWQLHTCTHRYTCTHGSCTQAHMHTHMHTCPHEHMHTHPPMYTWTHTHAHMAAVRNWEHNQALLLLQGDWKLSFLMMTSTCHIHTEKLSRADRHLRRFPCTRRGLGHVENTTT